MVNKMLKFINKQKPKQEDSTTKLVIQTHTFGDMKIEIKTVVPNDLKTEAKWITSMCKAAHDMKQVANILCSSNYSWEGTYPLWTTIQEKFASIKDAISNAIQPVIGWFTSLKDKWDAFKSALSNFKLPGWVSKITDMMGGGVVGKVKEWLGGNYDVGSNRITHDQVAQIHKDEMIIPARQAQKVRAAGGNINNIDKLVNKPAKAVPVSTTTNNNQSSPVIHMTVNANQLTYDDVVKKMAKDLKLALANM